jgi:hypothetical protein
MSHRPEQQSFRACYLAGPAGRVGIHTAGPVVALYLVATIVAFIVGGIAWWAAVGLALVPTLIAAAIAVLGFRQVASRCTRCGEWAELVDDGAGQALCARCWQVIVG